MTRESWNTRVGFILAAVGSAVGLGNIWRFPWMTADNGGSAFLVVYLLIVVFVGVPGLLGVLVIGRRSKRNPVGALESLSGSRRWGYVGLFAVLTSMFLLTFYSVVGGWTLRYTVESLSGAYFADPAAYFTAVSFGPPAVAYHVVFLGLTAAIVFAGVRDGIELATKLMIPAIVVLLGGLAAWAMSLDGAAAGLDFYLSFDLAYLRANFIDVLGAAAGQALFTLSVGAGTMITYASYISEDRSLPFDGMSIAVLNTTVGFIAGLVVFPLLFTLGVDPGSGGAGAVFISLAGGFARLPFGEGIALVFFGVLALAALSSSISMLEVPVSYLVDEHEITRRQATGSLFAIFLVTGSVSAMRPAIFGFIADTLVDLMLTAGLLGFLLFAGWVLGRDAIAEFEMGAGTIGRAVSRPWLSAIAVVLPLFLGFTLISGILGAVGITVEAILVLAVTALLGGATFIGLKRPDSA
ncbi:Na+-dependent transporter of the SNF family [Halanaeroarchaeum sp. HSR-CO]|uniref:sodium-dependent transporter n=1 Tax=Halanaeroarchaeum sp. HSR-CO TaxID=2866382 RepID=UPI00217DDB4B|nr:sodium-dependent transporter [Halanaeroarchaeum sp. HSR-CO]UWG48534.1 Na+-dependent transporter of the SNF family [Halanaeroarchaeum sp. HSR-CO]